ncbi:MAG TPA: hypothetical protein VJ773_02695 [Gemmatimonadales bacterium]|nr:hypothetical protein [Gemmatimonadales bacterium]
MRGRAVALALLAVALGAGEARAQWVTTDEQAYLQAGHNWAFRRAYPGADRLFNGFDYGHAILYETLLTRPDADPAVLEEREFLHLVGKVLRNPPALPLEEAAIEVEYARLVPEVKLLFDWAHLLHRQVYDVWADERLDGAAKDAAVDELVRYYLSRPDLALAPRPKSLELMEGQDYSLAFRERYPRFNGLIWAYHWLQVGLYDALLVEAEPAGRQRRVAAAVGRFWQMVAAGLDGLPHLMPMTAVVAPRFAARHPEAAAIFDNLHALHDVVSDILASDRVPPARKRAELLRMAARYRDAGADTVPHEEWRAMGERMGEANQGGRAVGFGAALPVPTVRRGAPHHEVLGH